jgi:hypothetical protein
MGKYASKGESKRRSDKPNHYRYYDTRLGREVDITLEQLKLYGEELPIKCQEIILSNRRMTGLDNQNLTLLHDLSAQIWSYGMGGKLPEIRITEYRSEFYVQMIKYLTRFDRSRGCWVAQARFAGYDTTRVFMKELINNRRVDEAMTNFMLEAKEMSPYHFDAETGEPL